LCILENLDISSWETDDEEGRIEAVLFDEKYRNIRREIRMVVAPILGPPPPPPAAVGNNLLAPLLLSIRAAFILLICCNTF